MRSCFCLFIVLLCGLALSCSSNPVTLSSNLPITSTELPTALTTSNPSPPSEPTSNIPIPKQPSAPPTSKPTLNLIYADPAEVDNSELPITPVEGLGTTGNPPEVDIASYRFSVNGLVDTPITLTYNDLFQYRNITEVVLLICPGFFADNAKWTGVPVITFLTQAGVQPGASQVVVHAVDGYSQTFSLYEIYGDDVFLAYMVNDQVLPLDHGYPLRLVVKGKYGSLWVKWVDGLEVK